MADGDNVANWDSEKITNVAELLWVAVEDGDTIPLSDGEALAVVVSVAEGDRDDRIERFDGDVVIVEETDGDVEETLVGDGEEDLSCLVDLLGFGEIVDDGDAVWGEFLGVAMESRDGLDDI